MISLAIIIIGSLTALFIAIYMVPKTQKASVVFSDFNKCFPINNYNVHWGVFNDNPYNGNSNMTIKTQSNPENTNDCYAVLSFYLGKESTIKPFCGVVAGFAPRPIESRDVSIYDGIQFRTWHEDEESLPEEVHVYIQISPHRLIYEYDGYHQYEFTKYVKSREPIKVTVPFSEFEQPPERQGPKVPFIEDFQKAIYQIAIVVQGEKGRVTKGEIMIDNIVFFK